MPTTSTVNLKPYKFDLLDGRVAAITTAFENDAEVGSLYKTATPRSG